MASRYAWAAVAVLVGVLAVAAQDQPPGPVVPQYKRMLKGEDAKRAAEILNQIRELEADGKRDEAKRIAWELFTLRERVQGKDHWETRDAEWRLKDLAQPLSAGERGRLAERSRLSSQVSFLYRQGKTKEALPLAEKALSIARACFGDTHPGTASNLNNLGFLYQDQGRVSEAESLLREALAVRRKSLGNIHPDTATSQDNLAGLCRAVGRMADAETLVREALDVRRDVFGDAHEDTISSRNNLAVLYFEQGKLSTAEPLLKEVLAATRSIRGERHTDTASSLSNLAGVYRATGKLVEAESLFKQALAIHQNTSGDAHPKTADCRTNLAGVYRDQGKFVDAEPLLIHVLAASWNTHGEFHANTARNLNNLATLYADQGKLAEAEHIHRRALATYQTVFGDSHLDVARSLHNIGTVYLTQGKLSDADLSLTKSLAIFQQTLGSSHPDTAEVLHALGNLYRKQDKLSLAESHCQNALKARRKVLGTKHPATAMSLTTLGELNVAVGRLAEAEAMYHEALVALRSIHGDAHPKTARCLQHLGSLYRVSGKLADAESLLRQTVAAAEAVRLAAARGLDRAVAEDSTPSQTLTATLAAQGNFPAATAALEAGLARGLLDEIAARRPASLTSDESDQRDAITVGIARIQPRVFFLATKQELSDAEHAELATLTAERTRLDAKLADLAVTVSRREVAEPAAIRAALPADAAWVAWLDLANKGGVVESWACVVRPVGEPRWVKLTGTGEKGVWTADDSDLPGRLRLAVAGRAKTVTEPAVPPAPAAAVADLARRLRDQRLAPVLAHLAGVKTLHVSATGRMAGVPVDLLAPEFTVGYTPSGTFLARLKDRPRPAGDRVLALGDPVFTRRGAPPPALKPLPPAGVLVTTVAPGGAAAKALIRPGDVLLKYGPTELTDAAVLQKAIADHADRKTVPVVVWRETEKDTATRDVDAGKLGVVLHPDPAPAAVANRRKLDALVTARGGEWKELPGTRVELDRLGKLFGNKTTILADTGASEHRLNDLRKGDGLKRFRFLHLATHGEGNTVRAMESSLILAQDDLPGELVAKEGEPLLDGRLTAREVLDHWRLDAELVTLSACETAIGVEAGGEGLLGFAQAFLTAGSRSVCLSLWQVDDTATALLMDRFYQNVLGRREGLSAPMGKAAALAEAKKWLRELTSAQVLELAASFTNGVVRGPNQPAVRLEPRAAAGGGNVVRPFAHPQYWAAFILIGDPN